MTSADFIKMVRAKLEANKVDPAKYDTLMPLMLNTITMQRLWNFYNWDEKRKTETASLATNDYTKTLATDFDQIESMTFKGTEEQPPIRVVSESFLLSQYPNVNNSAAGIPAYAAIAYDSTLQRTRLLIAPKANKSYTLEVIGRRKVPGIDEVPGYLMPTLEKMFMEDLKIPTTEADMILASAVQKEGQIATNITPKAIPDRSTMESGIGRDGRHIFNVGGGCE